MASAAFLNALRMRQLNQPKAKTRLRKPPKWLLPLGIERDYTKQLLGIVEFVEQEIERNLVANLPSLVEEANALRPDSRMDDFISRLAHILGAINLTLADRTPDFTALAAGIAQKVGAFNKEQERKILGATLSVDVFQAEPWLGDQLKLFAAQNAKLIKSIPEELLSSVEGIAHRGLASGTRPEDLAALIRERFGVSKSKARLLARDQVSKLNGNLTELRQRDLGVSRYIWRSSQDERVRKSHREKNGKIFEWANPPADTGHPGQDFQCRCYAEPYLQDLVDQSSQNT